MVEKGTPANEIRKELGIKLKALLKGMYYKALVEVGRIKDIVTERKMKKAAPKRRPLRIGKRGIIPLSKAFLAELGFKHGGAFQVNSKFPREEVASPSGKRSREKR